MCKASTIVPDWSKTVKRLHDIFPSIVGSLDTPRSKEAIESVAKVNETQAHIIDLNRKLTAGPCSFRADDIAWLLEVAYAATEYVWWQHSKADIREELHQEQLEDISNQVLTVSQTEIPEWLKAKIEEQDNV